MKARTAGQIISSCALFALAFSALYLSNDARSYIPSAEAPQWLVIKGMVKNPLNLSYDELSTFPQLSEVAELRCITPGTDLAVTYNWTGVPLFYLMSLAKVIPGANRVVFNCVDGYSGNITLETAMFPTTILGLEANGMDLNQLTGFGSGSRIVLPCRWGYKWAMWVSEIVVLASSGSCSEGIRADLTMPETQPSLQIMNFSKSLSSESADFSVLALSTASIVSSDLRSDRELIFNLSQSQQAGGIFYSVIPKGLLADPCVVCTGQSSIDCIQTESSENVFVYVNFTVSQSLVVKIRGSYTEQMLQSMFQYRWSNGIGIVYYDVELGGRVVHLVCRYD